MTSILEEVLIDMLADIKDNQLRLSRLERRESRQRHLNAGKVRTLTIATGEITVRSSDSSILIETQGAAATDDLDTINGGTEGQLIVFRIVDNARVPTFKDGTNLKLAGDFALDTTHDTIVLQQRAGGSWVEWTRSNNA